MKSFSTILYDEPAVRSTAVAVQFPAASALTAERTRLPAGKAMSYVKQSPETCGKRPAIAGICETPFSRNCFSSEPVMVTVALTFPKGSTVRTWPRVIGYGGGVEGGQKSLGFSVVGHV